LDHLRKSANALQRLSAGTRFRGRIAEAVDLATPQVTMIREFALGAVVNESEPVQLKC